MPLYNPANAVAYAHKWAFLRNPRYGDFSNLGGDCTNFISQCLRAGGLPMDYSPVLGWFYNSMSSRSPSFTGVEFLYSYLTGGGNPAARVTDFRNIVPGNVIQLSFDGLTFAHSLLVVGADSEITVATHSYDADNRPLSSYEYAAARGLSITR
ncbi:MAG: amidase domain-containing protein [Oscillospiraceae bacterium]|jgi:hypothetical protein|nr:amidase domain-containing protein [Oscillospiraceae bacterium]